MSGSQIIGSSDRIPFTGPRTPMEVKMMVKGLKNVEKDTFRKLLKAAVSLIEGNDVPESTFSSLAKDNLSLEMVNTVFAGICTLLRCALRIPVTSLKPEVFKEDLKELRRSSLETALVTNRSRLPTLDRLRWRLDVGISTSALNRVLEPTILMELTLSNGSIHNLEVPVSKFHELRYSVAYVLKDMEELEKRSILKIE
ncbi:COMM domain-containing protein 5-like isoform X2 [Acanthaster planci]|uniref:COMM domain-containing protein 5 n=1 Tax=Acanthaster planci TaxID=133434 RepID=A0A8B7Y0Y4_ACAPL|nr:COMM domain-containing protein 5-like isoform X2 [Acanthaster planci]